MRVDWCPQSQGPGHLAHTDPTLGSPGIYSQPWILPLPFSCLPTCSMDLELWGFKQ